MYIIKNLICILIFTLSFALQAEEAIVQNVINGYFTIKGYDFPYVQIDLKFPIELGDTLTIESEGLNYFPGHSYQVFFLLKHPKTGETQLFTSRAINNEEIEVIEEVEKTSQNIVRWTHGGKDFNCYGIQIYYRIKLESGSEYTLFVYQTSAVDSKEVAEKIRDSIEIVKGDAIILGKGTYATNNYGFYPEVYNQKNGQIGGKLTLVGPKRASNEEEGQPVKAITIRSIYRESYRCNFDSVCYKPPVVIFNNFGRGIAFDYKTDIDLKKFKDIPLTYKGYFDENGQRYYRFTLVDGKKSHTIDAYYKETNTFYYRYHYEGLFGN